MTKDNAMTVEGNVDDVEGREGEGDGFGMTNSKF